MWFKREFIPEEEQEVRRNRSLYRLNKLFLMFSGYAIGVVCGFEYFAQTFAMEWWRVAIFVFITGSAISGGLIFFCLVLYEKKQVSNVMVGAVIGIVAILLSYEIFQGNSVLNRTRASSVEARIDSVKQEIAKRNTPQWEFYATLKKNYDSNKKQRDRERRSLLVQIETNQEEAARRGFILVKSPRQLGERISAIEAAEARENNAVQGALAAAEDADRRMLELAIESFRRVEAGSEKGDVAAVVVTFPTVGLVLCQVLFAMIMMYYRSEMRRRGGAVSDTVPLAPRVVHGMEECRPVGGDEPARVRDEHRSGPPQAPRVSSEICQRVRMIRGEALAEGRSVSIRELETLMNKRGPRISRETIRLALKQMER